jgi:DNA-binding MarR family transcriptional regulator
MNDDSDSVDFCITDIGSRYPEIHPEVEGVVDRVAAIGKHVTRAFEDTLAAQGLNHGEYKLLLRLATRAKNRQMSAGDLSRALMLSSGATTNRLDRLENAGLVRRVPDPRDRRGVLVELTPVGEKQIDSAVTQQAAKEIDLLSGLAPGELTTLNQLLRTLLSTIEARPGAPRLG